MAVGVFVGTGLPRESPAGVAVGVTVGVAVGVTVGVAVGVTVGAAVGVTVGAAVGVTVGVAVGAVTAASTLTIPYGLEMLECLPSLSKR